MRDLPALIGFRRDRIGARLICLLNMIRLGRLFDQPAPFIWLSEPDGPYPELTDPREFLDADFVARHILVTTQQPDLGGRSDLCALAPKVDLDLLGRRLRDGETFFCEEAFAALTFVGESATEVRARIAAIAQELPLAPRLAQALSDAEHELFRRFGHGLDEAAAVHMRRGDLLDGNPWSLGAWPAKFTPDEFLLAWAQMQSGAVIVFTDTPEAAHELAQKDARIQPIDRLLDLTGLTATERDMLELLLMSRCRRIGAASGSAFSLAAAVIGRARLEGLPHGLPQDIAHDAYQALLDRAIEAPDSFHAPGDLAQSLHFAAAHAIAQGQAGRLVDALSTQRRLMRHHPFVRRILAECLMSAGRQKEALKEAQKGLRDERMVRRDKKALRVLLTSAQVRDNPEDDDSAQAFLALIFSSKAGEGAETGRMAARLLARPGPAADALMFPHMLSAGLAGTDPSGAAFLHPWFYLADWEELLDGTAARRPLVIGPDLHQKLRALGPCVREVDRVLTDGHIPDAPQSEEQAQQLGLGAALLSLHGRYARALRILHWLEGLRPDDALLHKRLADTCFRLGNLQRGEEHLLDALRLSNEPPLMQLSMARRLADLGRLHDALAWMRKAQRQWPDSELLKRQKRRMKTPAPEAAQG